MRKILPFLFCIVMTGCGGAEPAAVSRIQPAAGAMDSSLNYQGYRAYVSRRAQAGDGWASDIMSQNYGDSSAAMQKRFMALDRNNDGRLSGNEIGAPEE